MSDKNKASVREQEDGPLVVKNLTRFELADGSSAEMKPIMALCRCGASKNKPFCDGSHKEIGFASARGDVAERDEVSAYTGNGVTVHYNRLICSHAGQCSAKHAEIFNPSRNPWIAPDQGSIEDIEEVVAACPSGALRYSTGGAEPRHLEHDECAISVEKDGPYHVQNVEIDGVRWAQGASERKFVLCRCGLSGNKPFCDGAHYDAKWRDDA